MSALQLRSILADAGIEVLALAKHCELSRSITSRLVNHGRFPVRRDGADLRRQITEFLQQRGLDTARAFQKEKAPVRCNAPEPDAHPKDQLKEDAIMLLRKQTLSAAARQHFKLARDPFTDCREPADVFLSPDIRYVRESMASVVKHGGFLAVIGESGAGKSTLREELLERLQTTEQGVVVIQPYVLAMEDRDTVGKTLRSQHIAEAIVSAVAPLAPTRSSPEARFKQLHDVLRDSARSGMRHVLLIEEAHCLPIPTLKHLKRYLELKDGMRPLLSIILLGQPELAIKLSEQDPGVREVVQRIEIVHLAPLDQGLGAYIKHRFERVGIDAAEVIDESGVSAIRSRLTPDGARVRAGSLLYPLAVNNVLAAAMNAAAELRAPLVTRDLVGAIA